MRGVRPRRHAIQSDIIESVVSFYSAGALFEFNAHGKVGIVSSPFNRAKIQRVQDRVSIVDDKRREPLIQAAIHAIVHLLYPCAFTGSPGFIHEPDVFISGGGHSKRQGGAQWIVHTQVKARLIAKSRIFSDKALRIIIGNFRAWAKGRLQRRTTRGIAGRAGAVIKVPIMND